jgi:hypothetical protein
MYTDVSKEHINSILGVENQPSKKSLPSWFLARRIFDPEDGSNVFVRNVGSHTNYTALYP